jgi:hypothetical protein
MNTYGVRSERIAPQFLTSASSPGPWVPEKLGKREKSLTSARNQTRLLGYPTCNPPLYRLTSPGYRLTRQRNEGNWTKDICVFIVRAPDGYSTGIAGCRSARIVSIFTQLCVRWERPCLGMLPSHTVIIGCLNRLDDEAKITNR